MTKKLEKDGLDQSKFDPFLFSVRKSHVLYMLTILSFGIGTKTTSITCLFICEIRVLIWNKRKTL